MPKVARAQGISSNKPAVPVWPQQLPQLPFKWLGTLKIKSVQPFLPGAVSAMLPAPPMMAFMDAVVSVLVSWLPPVTTG